MTFSNELLAIIVSPLEVAIIYALQHPKAIHHLQTIAIHNTRLYFKTSDGLGAFIAWLERRWERYVQEQKEKNTQKRRFIYCQ